jgi:hypothetical protein
MAAYPISFSNFDKVKKWEPIKGFPGYYHNNSKAYLMVAKDGPDGTKIPCPTKVWQSALDEYFELDYKGQPRYFTYDQMYALLYIPNPLNYPYARHVDRRGRWYLNNMIWTPFRVRSGKVFNVHKTFHILTREKGWWIGSKERIFDLSFGVMPNNSAYQVNLQIYRYAVQTLKNNFIVLEQRETAPVTLLILDRLHRNSVPIDFDLLAATKTGVNPY